MHPDRSCWSQEAVRFLRNIFRMKRKQFSDLLGVPTRTILRWEKGESFPSRRHVELLNRIAREIGIDIKSQMTIEALLSGLDRDTAEHSRAVADIAYAFAVSFGIPRQDRVTLRNAALLHDVDKISWPDRLLVCKPSEMTRRDYDCYVYPHPIRSARIAQRIVGQKVGNVIACHHEGLDGSGYPRALRANEIPLLSRILRVVDVADALTRPRPYRPHPVPFKEVLRILTSPAYDQRIVTKFLTWMRS